MTSFRIGHGYDIHRLVEGDGIMVGGVKIPCDKKAEAHSDGDVVLHALTDALLGTLGLGDIGQHFPPSDPQWKNANSSQFVEFAIDKLKERGGEVVNADLTVVLEAPKLGAHRDKIVDTVAKLLGVAPSQVNLKATTNEGLGPVGKGEGAAAWAVILISHAARAKPDATACDLGE